MKFVDLNFLSYHRLIKPLLQFKAKNPGMELKSNGVKIFFDKHGRNSLDYIPCAVKIFKKGSTINYRRILLKQKPTGSITYREKMEKRFYITLKQEVTEMPNNGPIPTGKSDIMHHLILLKTRTGEVIKGWSSEKWN